MQRYPTAAPPYAPPPQGQPYPPPPAGPRTGVVVLVTAVVAGLVGALLGVTATLAVQSLDGPDPAPAREGQRAADVLPQRLPVLVDWVQDRVGRDFEVVPQVVVLADDEFEDAVLAPLPAGAAQPRSLPTDDFTATVTALGLVEDPDAYDEFVDEGFADGVVGFYDTVDEVIRLRGTTWGPTTEVTLVHELVHAIQDQVVDLDALTARTASYDESYQSLSAVIEGQATVVEQDWLAERGEAYTERYYQDGPSGGAYEPLGAALSWLPYDVGGWAVGVLEEAEGPQATFEVLASPPTTLEQLWDVEGWRAGGAGQADPAELDPVAPPDGLDAVDRGELGVHLLSLLVLDDPDDYPELPYEDELPLAGWDGDQYVTWVEDGRACTRLVLRSDSARAASDLVEGLDPWVERGGRVDAAGTGLTLQRCADR